MFPRCSLFSNTCSFFIIFLFLSVHNSVRYGSSMYVHACASHPPTRYACSVAMTIALFFSLFFPCLHSLFCYFCTFFVCLLLTLSLSFTRQHSNLWLSFCITFVQTREVNAKNGQSYCGDIFFPILMFNVNIK